MRSRLALVRPSAMLRAMKFLAAIAVYLLIGIALGWGIILAMKGSMWFLAAGVAVYVLAFAKIGCLPKAH